MEQYEILGKKADEKHEKKAKDKAEKAEKKDTQDGEGEQEARPPR
jgi:hypothetical protein